MFCEFQSSSEMNNKCDKATKDNAVDSEKDDKYENTNTISRNSPIFQSISLDEEEDSDGDKQLLDSRLDSFESDTRDHSDSSDDEETPAGLPLSVICATEELESLLHTMYHKSKKVFLINLATTILFVGVVIGAIVVYMQYKDNCSSMGKYGSITIGLTGHLLLYYFGMTCFSGIVLNHCRNLLPQKKKKHVEFTKKTPKGLEEQTFYLKSEMNDQQNDLNIAHLIQAGERMTHRKYTDNVLRDFYLTHKRADLNNTKTEDMERAIHHVRKMLHRRRINNSTLISGLPDAINCTLCLIFSVPIAVLMFWMFTTEHVYRERKDKNCTTPFMYFWVITICIVLCSLLQLIPIITYYTKNMLKLRKKNQSNKLV